jgi:septal ring factor EnvC (AmiA/AmiB activator)
MPSHEDRKPAPHSAQTRENGQAKAYTSPPRKLMCFFAKSREPWKAKCLEAKTNVKYLRNRIRFLAKSQDRWKHRVRELAADLAKLEAQVRARDNEIEALKKTLRRPL